MITSTDTEPFEKNFSLYLLKNDIISREEFLSIVKHQKKDTPRIDELALEKGVIDNKKIHYVHSITEKNGSSFKETVLKEKILSEDIIAQLSAEQRNRHIPLDKAIVDLNIFCEKKLKKYIEDFSHKNNTNEISFSLMSQEDGFKDRLSKYIDKNITLFSQLFDEKISFKSIEAIDEIDSKESIAYDQVICLHTKEVVIGIIASKEMCRHIAQKILDMPIHQVDNLTKDCIAEYLNICMGHLITDDYFTANKTKILPPEELTLKDISDFKNNIEIIKMSSPSHDLRLFYAERPMKNIH